WKKLYAAESILKNLRSQKLFYPTADERPRYPFSLLDKLRPHEHIGFFEGQASAFYNVSPVERDYFEMWYFDNLAAYKGAAHNDPSFIRKGHDAMDAKLIDITKQADKLIKLGSKEKSTGKEIKPGNLWFKGQYTEYNQVHN
ncbi:MAG: hydroxylamine oxidoreductase, partial [Gammaproteobacteria bacterium]|nr:hydroxylamine oxidoreductase [Gammaproteobacteria bacterium]